MAKTSNSYAQRMVDAKGVEFARQYLRRPEDGTKLSKCQYGHDDCAHYGRGPCMKEMIELTK